MDIKYNSSNLVLLDDRSREAKSIGVVDSRCQVCDFVLFLNFHFTRVRGRDARALSSQLGK